jgi:hypothetical protein
LVVVTAAAIVAFDMNAGKHFQTVWHGQFGLAILILTWVQGIIGVFRPHAPGEGTIDEEIMFNI